MPIPSEYVFTRYLSAKKSADDRALNRVVWDKLADLIAAGEEDNPLRILEVGAGIGTMVERMLEWGLLPAQTSYTAIDARPDNIQHAKARLTAWGATHQYDVTRSEHAITLSYDQQRVKVELEAIDVFDFISREQGKQHWDLLVAHAFLDLMHLPTMLPALFSLTAQDGLLYATLNFDGITALQPSISPTLDSQIEALYHADMDARRIDGHLTGGSQTGRQLFEHIQQAGGNIIAAGSSDWVVFSQDDGYPSDEAYFLHYIIHTIEGALRGHAALDNEAFTDWIEERHQQIKSGKLIYIAHQLDILAHPPDTSQPAFSG